MDRGTDVAEATATTEEAKPIEFKGRTILTYMPNDAQMAVIARMTYLTNEDAKDVEKVRKYVNRVGKLLAGLMVNQGDWDWIEDGMAAREIDWREVLDIFMLVADAHGLRNRAARRAAKSTRARRG